MKKVYVLSIALNMEVFCEQYRNLTDEEFNVKLFPHHLKYLKKGSSLSYYPHLLRNLIKFRPNIIHISDEPSILSTCQIIFWSKLFLRKTKLISFTWENIFRKRKWPIPLLRKYCFRNLDLIIAGNKEAIKVLREYGYKGKIIHLAQRGINTERFKKKDNKDNKKIVIGYVGRMIKEKGILTLLEASKDLDKKFQLLIMGDGDIEVKENERIERIKKVNYYDLPKYYNQMDIFILPSITSKDWKEQFGYVIIEAMSCEVPVIVSNSGAKEEVVGDAGLTFKEGDHKDLSKKIKQLENKKEREKWGKKGRKRAKEVYSLKVIGKKTKEIWRNLYIN